jgi:hypothetical protein
MTTTNLYRPFIETSITCDKLTMVAARLFGKKLVADDGQWRITTYQWRGVFYVWSMEMIS